jgi:AcrR family transcriptional regulator
VSPTENIRRGLTLAERQDVRREELLDAALELFGTRGYARTPVKQICRQAQVSSRDFYDLFANREDVLLALGARVQEMTFTAFIEAWEHAKGRPLTRVTAASAAVTRALTSDPRIARIAFVETLGVSPRQDEARRTAIRAFADQLALLLQDDFARAGLDPRRTQAVSMVLVAGLTQLIADWALNDQREPAEEFEQLVSETFRLLFPKPKRSRPINRST